MDPQVSGSFIPKKPLSQEPRPRRTGGAFNGLLFLIGMLCLVASGLAAGGAFAYQSYLQSSIASKSASLTAAQGAFDPSTIQDLVRLDSRINNAETLLASHVAPSAIFAFLSANTLENVTFTSLDYELADDGTATLTLTGQADSFSTLALQSDQFGASQVLKDTVFSTIAVDPTGKINFTVVATLDPSLINYANTLGTASTTPATAAPDVTSTSTSSDFTQ